MLYILNRSCLKYQNNEIENSADDSMTVYIDTRVTLVILYSVASILTVNSSFFKPLYTQCA